MSTFLLLEVISHTFGWRLVEWHARDRFRALGFLCPMRWSSLDTVNLQASSFTKCDLCAAVIETAGVGFVWEGRHCRGLIAENRGQPEQMPGDVSAHAPGWALARRTLARRLRETRNKQLRNRFGAFAGIEPRGQTADGRLRCASVLAACAAGPSVCGLAAPLTIPRRPAILSPATSSATNAVGRRRDTDLARRSLLPTGLQPSGLLAFRRACSL